MLFFNSKIANLTSTNLKPLFFISALLLIGIARAHESNHETHSAQSFLIDSIESQERIRSFFNNYTNNQSLMNSTQVNTFLENFINILEHHDHEHHQEKEQEQVHHNENKRDATLSNDHNHKHTPTSHTKCLREKLNSYKQDSNNNIYLNETNFSKLTALIVNDISFCLSINETNEVNSIFKPTNIIIKTKSEYIVLYLVFNFLYVVYVICRNNYTILS
jgi:hypothetical protein